MNEIWKSVTGYEGLYEVSNLGRVKSLVYKRLGHERILKSGNNMYGYKMVVLRKNNKSKTITVHILVAQAFIPNPDNLPEVNHIDENKSNNSVDNLEWCTRKYNLEYGNRIKKLEKPIIQYSKEGEFIKEWPSIVDVERQLGYNKSNIASCCRGLKHHRTAYGYIWKFKNNPELKTC